MVKRDTVDLTQREREIFYLYQDISNQEGERGATRKVSSRMGVSMAYVSTVVKKATGRGREPSLDDPSKAFRELTHQIRDIQWQIDKRSRAINKLEEDEESLGKFQNEMWRTLELLREKVEALKVGVEDLNKDKELKAMVNQIFQLLVSKHSPLQFVSVLKEHREQLLAVDEIIKNHNDNMFRVEKIQQILYDADPELLPDGKKIELAKWFTRKYCPNCPGNQERLKDILEVSAQFLDDSEGDVYDGPKNVEKNDEPQDPQSTITVTTRIPKKERDDDKGETQDAQVGQEG